MSHTLRVYSDFKCAALKMCFLIVIRSSILPLSVPFKAKGVTFLSILFINGCYHLLFVVMVVHGDKGSSQTSTDIGLLQLPSEFSQFEFDTQFFAHFAKTPESIFFLALQAMISLQLRLRPISYN